MENVFGSLTLYGESWNVTGSRKFNDTEIAAVKSCKVTVSEYGKSACFFMVGGGQTFIPLSNKNQDLAVDTELDVKAMNLLTLERTGSKPIIRVEL